MLFKNILVFAVIAGLVITIFGCEHAPVNPTEDSKRLQQIDAYIENLRVVYEGKNFQAFSSQYLGDHPDDLRTVTSFFDTSSSPHLDFMIDRIVLQGEIVRVSLHWELHWNSEKTGAVKQRGNALFQLAGKSDLHLQAIEGDNPFTAPATYRVSQP